MEFIKKQIKLKTITGNTIENNTIIIPDLNAIYNMKVLLSANAQDFGFFDVYEDPLATGATGASISNQTYTITGFSSSRLVELRKYSTSSDLNKRFFTSTDPAIDGLDLSKSITGGTGTTLDIFVYYISGITYTDTVETTGTTTIFNFISSGCNTPNIINLPIIKDEAKENIIDKPEIINNVFIERQQVSVFENNFRLRNIQNIQELEFYAGGAHFNIVNNT